MYAKTVFSITSLFVLLGSASIAQGTESRLEIYQTMTHCSGGDDCRDSTKIPDCKLTLGYEGSAIRWIEVYGLGENSSGMKGYFSISNSEDTYSSSEGPQVKSNDVTVRGSSISAKLLASALRWGVYSEVVEFEVKGFTPEAVRSVHASFAVRLARIPGTWIKIGCENLTRFQP